MKASINVEFTDDELKRYAGDVGRRWIAHALDEGIKAGKKLKINPDLLGSIVGPLAAAIGSKLPPDPGPISGAPEASESYVHVPRNRCETIRGDAHIDDGWVCHKCSVYNGMQREKCRNCAHERCDVIVTPPPASPIDPSVQ